MKINKENCALHLRELEYADKVVTEYVDADEKVAQEVTKKLREPGTRIEKPKQQSDAAIVLALTKDLT